VAALRPDEAPQTSQFSQPSQPTSRRVRRLAATALSVVALTAVTGTLATASPAAAVPVRPAGQAANPTGAVVAADAAARAFARTHPTLRYGSKGSAVRKLQGYVGVRVDGRFGAATRAKVRKVQKWGHVQVNGVVDVGTWHVAYRFSVARAKARATRLSPANIIRTARKYIGGPYRFGGTTPRGFDCSGYTRYVFAKLGVGLPHSAARQYSLVRHISRSQARPGDLIFFHSGSHVFHVGIWAGHDGLYHASHPGRRTGYERLWTSAVWFGRVL